MFQTVKDRDDDDESHTSGGTVYVTVSVSVWMQTCQNISTIVLGTEILLILVVMD